VRYGAPSTVYGNPPTKSAPNIKSGSALFSQLPHATMPVMSKLDGMKYRIDLWNSKTGSILKHIGNTTSIDDARAMFEQACEDYTAREITLRSGARVLKLRPAPETAPWSGVPFTEAEKRLDRELALIVFGRLQNLNAR